MHTSTNQKSKKSKAFKLNDLSALKDSSKEKEDSIEERMVPRDTAKFNIKIKSPTNHDLHEVTH